MRIVLIYIRDRVNAQIHLRSSTNWIDRGEESDEVMKKAKNTVRPGSLRAGQADGGKHWVRSGVRSSLALGLSALAFAPASVLAQEAVKQLSTVKVEDTPIDPNPNAETGVPYKAKTSGDERHTRPLAETPQTIQVVTAEAIADSGQTDLAK